MRTGRLTLLLVILTIGIMSCSNSSSIIPSEVKGIYEFKYPSGQVDILIIEANMTFNQKQYSSQMSYDSGDKPTWINSGTWSFNGDEFDFEHYMISCAPGEPKDFFDEPEIGTVLGPIWIPPNENYEGAISFFEETGYVFHKVSSTYNTQER